MYAKAQLPYQKSTQEKSFILLAFQYQLPTNQEGKKPDSKEEKKVKLGIFSRPSIRLQLEKAPVLPHNPLVT